MKVLVTGSSGHLGEALVRRLQSDGHEVVALDLVASPFTSRVGSIADRAFVRENMHDVGAVMHTATLHKPHVDTHTRQAFVDTNLTGTLNLLEEASSVGVRAFVFTSTTSAFGDALTPPQGAPAAWITEDVAAVPKNIYGVTKVAAENLCELFARNQKLPCVILRTSRFFPEEDDSKATRDAYEGDNAKVNELLYRRADLADIVDAHVLAHNRACSLGSGVGCARYIISATTPFGEADLAELRADAPRVVRRLFPAYEEVFGHRGWRMFPSIDRVYVNSRARRELDWRPRYDFGSALLRLGAGEDPQSPLARLIGAKGYHPKADS